MERLDTVSQVQSDSAGARVALPQVFWDAGVVPVLRAASADRFPAVAEILLDSGARVLEVTLTSRGALEAIASLAKQLPTGACLGAGTVLSADDAIAAIDAGAQFLVAPTRCHAVTTVALAHGVPSFAGALTPTEVLEAWNDGASAVKIFPASIGGPEYLRAIAAPLPGIPLMPTGGIGLVEAPDYIRAGAIAVGVGGPLLGDSTDPDGDLAALGRRARTLTESIGEAVGARVEPR